MWQSNGRAPRGKYKGQGKQQGRAPRPPPAPPPGGYRILVLAGIPGSGKSTLASFLEDMGWSVVNQDTLGSREKCRRRAQQVLEKGGRVLIDRCNFDQSQRVTWLDLAVSHSLHKDACIAVWLDIPIDVCQGRVQSRVGHPTLGAGLASAGIVKRYAKDFRPPHRKEGFHTVLRCHGDQDLSEAIALLSLSAGSDGAPGTERAPAPPATTAGSDRVGGDLGGGTGWRRGVDSVGMCWDQSLAEEGSQWNMNSCPPGEVGAVATAPTVHHAVDIFFPVEKGATTAGMATKLPGAAPGQGGVTYHTPASADAPMTRPEYDRGPVLACGGQQQVGGGGAAGPVARTRDAVGNNGRTAANDATSDPSLPSAMNGDKRGRFVGSLEKQLPHRPKQRGFTSSSLNSIAKLTSQSQAEALASVKQSLKPKTRLLTPAEICSNFSDLQAPPRVLAPEDVGVAASARTDRLGTGPTAAATGKRDEDHSCAQPVVLPLGPNSIEEWPSRSTFPIQGNEENGNTGNSSYRSEEAATAEGGQAHDHRERVPAGAWDGDDQTNEEEADLDVSDGEAFFVLEDMFGGLLPPETLENLFAESGNYLEKAVKEGFKVCEGLWGQGEVITFPDSPSSDGTTTDDFLTPSTSAGTDVSTNENGSDTRDDETHGKFADVLHWTPKQVDTLTELCLAFEATISRETIIAALTASDHDATSAAQLLLDPRPANPRERGEGRRSRPHRGVAQRERKARPPRSDDSLPTATSLGATCGVDHRAGALSERQWEEEDAEGEEEEEEEEEEGDEGLTSEEYRTRANAAAEQMKAWFQKAAEAFIRGGRNGGAAAADPSRIGQRWKKSMETANLRAAREAFRERNPLIRVGHTHDGVSVLKVLRLPEPSQCSTPGQLSVDLHLLRRAEALNVLETVLHAIRRRAGEHSRVLVNRPRAPKQSQQLKEHPDVVAAAAGQTEPSYSGASYTPPVAQQGEGLQHDRVIRVQKFASLEVVVGRGAHSVAGVPRLRPCVMGYLAGKGFRAEGVEGDRGKGVVVVGLR
ncbi:unnamed protein product [Ectocarpus sp. CCAP 1310/34]|nr:unnamed protein product [Ectocarpus sp. CCAP 1310/34]